MPQLNSRKKYKRYSYYHIYNRGVNKNPIFTCQWNRDVFLKYLEQASQKYSVNIVKYVLTTNHFHFIAKQSKDSKGIAKMMQSLGSRYTVFFNYNYDRVGCLFQSRYRARLLDSDDAVKTVSIYLEHHTKNTDEIFSEDSSFEF